MAPLPNLCGQGSPLLLFLLILITMWSVAMALVENGGRPLFRGAVGDSPGRLDGRAAEAIAVRRGEPAPVHEAPPCGDGSHVHTSGFGGGQLGVDPFEPYRAQVRHRWHADRAREPLLQGPRADADPRCEAGSRPQPVGLLLDELQSLPHGPRAAGSGTGGERVAVVVWLGQQQPVD